MQFAAAGPGSFDELSLEQAVEDKTFREDPFYRLQVLPVRMPSLAERRGDTVGVGHGGPVLRGSRGSRRILARC